MFTYIKRIFFFLLTNMAILLLLSLVMMGVNYFFPWLLAQYGSNTYFLIYAAVLGFGGAIISLFISKWSAKKLYNIQILSASSASSDPKLQVVWSTVERIAQASNIKMPEVWYFDSPDPNAFATGASKNNSLVAVSTGLLDMMDKKEIEWVVGHEMAHILNGDMVTLTLIQGVLNTFVIFLSYVAARAISAFLSRWDEWEGLGFLAYNLVYIVCQLVFWLFAGLVVMWFSRMREYRADHGGAQYTSKASMIAGLRKLKSYKWKMLVPLDKKMAAFMITEGESLFSSHPPLDKRIKVLEENYQLN